MSARLRSSPLSTPPGAISRRLGLAALAAIATPWATAAPVRPERSNLVLALHGKATLAYLPLTIAEQFGWFKAEGLNLEFNELASSTRAASALASGAADIVCGPFEQILHQPTRGPQAQAFVLMGLAPQVALAYSVRAMPAHAQLSDLKGRKIGVSAPGTTSHMVASHIVARAGLAASDVSYISVGSGAGAMAAVRSGQIDALCNSDPVITGLTQSGEVQIAVDTRNLQSTTELFGTPLPNACLSAMPDFVQRHPHTMQALCNAVVRALLWLRSAGPSALLKTVPESYLLGDRGLYLDAFNLMRDAFSPDGLMPDAGPRALLKAWAGFDGTAQRSEPIDLAHTYTNDFVRRVARRSA